MTAQFVEFILGNHKKDDILLLRRITAAGIDMQAPIGEIIILRKEG